MEHIYETDRAFVKEAINELLKNTSLKLTDNQKLLIEELYTYMNKETIFHSLNCVKFADEYIDKYGRFRFEKDFKISKNDFLIGMAIHDAGKVMVPKEILEKLGKLEGKEFDEMDKHSLPVGGHSLKVLNNCLEIVNKENNQTLSLREIGFSSKITDITMLHHSKRIIQKGLQDYIAISGIVDVSEAATGKRKYFENKKEFSANNESEKFEKAIKNANEWSSDIMLSFFKNSGKENCKNSKNNINKIQFFAKKVAKNNARFFQNIMGDEDTEQLNFEDIKKKESLNNLNKNKEEISIVNE